MYLLHLLLFVRIASATTIGIYGSTVCAVSACLAASRMGVNCTMVESTSHLFGMSTGGLSGVDLRMPLGGIALEIFGSKEFPNFPPSQLNRTILSLLGSAGPGVISIESHVGDIVRVEQSGQRITVVHFLSGFDLSADYWLDCSYEGDLLRLAGISFAVGREAASDYNETLAGANGGLPWNHSAVHGVSPFADSTNTTLIPTVVAQPSLAPSDGDGLVQSYNFRLTLTNNASNRLPLAPPPDYAPESLEFLRRWFRANSAVANASLLSLFLVRELGDSKIDVNQGSLPGASDLPGFQSAYPLSNWTARAAIIAQHEWWTRAIWEFLRTDEAVPPNLRAQAAAWGLAADEFVGAAGGFTPQLYIRESIRLRGEVVLTQADVFGKPTASSPTSVGLSQWLIDVHDTQRIATRLADESWIVAEAGNVNTAAETWQVTEIPYAALLPKRAESENLAVPVCASFTHIAYATYRLEPQYAIFGQSAAVAAVLAGQAGGLALQDVDVTALQSELLRQGQLLNATTPSPPPSSQQLILTPCTDAVQQWSWYPDGSLQPAPGGLCASIFGYSNASGARVVSAGCHTSTFPRNQAFDIVPAASGGGVHVRSRMSQLCIAPAADVDGAGLIQTECSNNLTAWEGVASTPNASAWTLLEAHSPALCAASNVTGRMPPHE